MTKNIFYLLWDLAIDLKDNQDEDSRSNFDLAWVGKDSHRDVDHFPENFPGYRNVNRKGRSLAFFVAEAPSETWPDDLTRSRSHLRCDCYRSTELRQVPRNWESWSLSTTGQMENYVWPVISLTSLFISLKYFFLVSQTALAWLKYFPDYFRKYFCLVFHTHL